MSPVMSSKCSEPEEQVSCLLQLLSIVSTSAGLQAAGKQQRLSLDQVQNRGPAVLFGRPAFSLRAPALTPTPQCRSVSSPVVCCKDLWVVCSPAVTVA